MLPAQEPPLPAQQPLYVQQPLPQQGYAAAPLAPAAAPAYAQPAAQQPLAAPLPQGPVDIASLMASLVSSGILAAPPQLGGGAPQPAAQAEPAGAATPPAVASPPRPEEPVSLEFAPERIKVHPAAAARCPVRLPPYLFLARACLSGRARAELLSKPCVNYLHAQVGGPHAACAALPGQAARRRALESSSVHTLSSREGQACSELRASSQTERESRRAEPPGCWSKGVHGVRHAPQRMAMPLKSMEAGGRPDHARHSEMACTVAVPAAQSNLLLAAQPHASRESQPAAGPCGAEHS